MNIKIKKYIKPFVFLYFVLSLAFLPVVVVNAITLPCNQGQVLCTAGSWGPAATGPDVGKLQQKLKDVWTPSLAVDCIFGDATLASVLGYQRSKGLTEDGMAGPDTLGKLNITISNSNPTGGKCTNYPGVQSDPCNVDDDCGQGLSCNAAKKCQVSGSDTACTPACNPDTQVCTNGTCVAKTNNPPPGSGNCGDPNLTYSNGLCLPNPPFGAGSLATNKTWQTLTKQIIEILLTVSGVIAVLFVLYGGFLYVTSAGNEEQAEKGKKALINAIIGLVIIILSYVIVNVLANLLIKAPT